MLPAVLQRNRGLALLAMQIGMILFYPLLEMPDVPLHALETLTSFGLLVLHALYRPTRPVWVASVCCAVLSVAGVWLQLTPWSQVLATSPYLYRLPALLLLISTVLRRVFSAGPMNMDRLLGTLCVFLLFGLLWANLYGLMEQARPGAFRFSHPVPPGAFFAELIYYSYVTLLTVGFGDVLPVHPLARALSILEALTGILFTAVAISRMSGALQVGDPRDPAHPHHHPHGGA